MAKAPIKKTEPKPQPAAEAGTPDTGARARLLTMGQTKKED